MLGNKSKMEASSTEMALARMDNKLDQISGVYEPLAVRVANLEALARTTQATTAQSVHTQARSDRSRGVAGPPPEDSSAMRRRTGWFRILRHMWPPNVRRLLAEHDEAERIQGELWQVELPKAIRAHGEVIASPDGPAFPEGIFRADAASKVTIIDVGAQDLAFEDHVYAPLQAAGATTIIGFEPLPDKDAAPRRADPSVVMLEHFVGAGEAATFHVTHFDPASSLFEPNHEYLAQFVGLSDMCKTVSSFEVRTTRLDDVPEISGCDYLKIDVQGGELDVLKGAQGLLEKTLAVHCEVEFAPVYKDQPLFADIDSYLRARGFELIDFVNAGYNRYKALPGPSRTGSRLLWSEAVYFKSSDQILRSDFEKFRKAAYIAHVNYNMYDLASHFLAEYDKIAGSSFAPIYLAALLAFVGSQKRARRASPREAGTSGPRT